MSRMVCELSCQEAPYQSVEHPLASRIIKSSAAKSQGVELLSKNASQWPEATYPISAPPMLTMARQTGKSLFNNCPICRVWDTDFPRLNPMTASSGFLVFDTWIEREMCNRWLECRLPLSFSAMKKSPRSGE